MQNQTELLSHTIYKNKLQCTKDNNVRIETVKLPEKGNIIAVHSLTLWSWQYFWIRSLRQGKQKQNKIGLCQSKKAFAQ